MRYRKTKRFSRYRSNDRNYQRHSNGGDQAKLGSSSFSNGRTRNNFVPQQSAEKLLERYNILAKEALSSGDRILSENYLQHADHFARIIEIKNINQNQNKVQSNEESQVPEIKSANNNETSQDKVDKEKKV